MYKTVKRKTVQKQDISAKYIRKQGLCSAFLSVSLPRSDQSCAGQFKKLMIVGKEVLHKPGGVGLQASVTPA